MWLCNQQLQLVYCQLNDWWISMHNSLAYWQPQDITHQARCCDQHNQPAEWSIWQGEWSEGDTREGTQVSGNNHWFCTPNKVKFTMIDYIKNMLAKLPSCMGRELTTPAGKHLSEVNEKGTKLDKTIAKLFHHNVAKLLFLCKRTRLDTFAISF